MFSLRPKQFRFSPWCHHISARRNQTRCRAADRDLDLDKFEQQILKLQDKITSEAVSLDGSGLSFLHDEWQRETGTGFGITCVLENGSVLEKAAVNISIIRGQLTPNRAATMSARGRSIDPKGGQNYSAAALSLVFHPRHPFIPTLRADVRRFSVEGEDWYGGGADLTPVYPFPEDFIEFHQFWKSKIH